MSLVIESREIDRVCVIDDDAEYRSQLEDTIIDAHLSAILQETPVNNVELFLSQVIVNYQAVVSDHHLMQREKYFPINGAQFVSMCYGRQMPAILITRLEQPNPEIRKYRRNIPIVSNPLEFDPDALIHGIDICLKEFDAKFSSFRKPWRTLIRVDEVDGQYVNIVIPGWDQNEKIPVGLSEIPIDIQKELSPDKRLHVKVNIGAESSDELYFFEWENK